MDTYTLVFMVLAVIVEGHVNQDLSSETVQIDYTKLAGEAELHKGDILNFLNQSDTRDQYKALYDDLLSRLIGADKDKLKLEGSRYKRATGELPAAMLPELGASGSTRRIVAGRNTSIASVPWQVSLREKTYPICGGSVLTDVWLITAAHCLVKANPPDLSVRLGSSWKTHGGEMYDVQECFVHPKYISKSKVNDVGLMRLYSPLRFSARVLPIRLVARDTRLPADQAGIVSGWGRVKEGGPSAKYLQSSTIKTISMKLCRRSGLDRKAIVPAAMFCAGSFDQDSPDACQGDSGGPIVSEGVLIGIVSWGLGCARGNFPGVYSRLSSAQIWDFVHQHISEKDVNSTSTLRQ